MNMCIHIHTYICIYMCASLVEVVGKKDGKGE